MDARELEAGPTSAEGHRSHSAPKARQVHFRPQAISQRRPALKLIRKLKASTARENDSLHLEDVLDHVNTARDPYGDNGYVDCGHEHRLKAQG